jgi:16S rRNA (guanine527-N7)-methyltransferase
MLLQKKIKVVNSVAEEIGLANVKGEQIRVEKLKGRYDFVVSRAVTNFSKFVKLVQKNISEKNINNFENGIIYLKGGDFQDEISEYQKVIKLYDIKDWFDEDFFDTKKVVYLPIKVKRAKK